MTKHQLKTIDSSIDKHGLSNVPRYVEVFKAITRWFVISLLLLTSVSCKPNLTTTTTESDSVHVQEKENKEVPGGSKTDDLKKALKTRIKDIITTWDEEGIYAISFFVTSNESYKYNGFSNVVNFAISYNTESDCPNADVYDEERWNYAYWRQDEVPIIYTDEKNPLADLLFEWYEECGLKRIGYESEDVYDENGNYRGKGPEGHYELLTLVSEIAAELQKEGFISKTLGKKLPIIIHGLEYAWFDIEATKRGNPNGEADVFLKACQELGFSE